MSHNILTLNNSAFDVNSNRTESISSSNYSYVKPSGGFQPIALSVGANFLFRKDEQINASTSWITQVDHATQANYVEKFRFTQDGTYRVFARCAIPYINIGATGNTQGFRLRDLTNNQFISSAFFHLIFNDSYCYINYMSSIIVRSGSDIDISVRCTAVGNELRSGNFDNYSIFTAEKLQ